MDKLQKIHEKVERIKTNANKRGAIGKYSTMIICAECAEILSLIDELQKEPVSEDLEEAAIDYDSCRPALYGVDDEGDYVECIEVRKDAFIAGAKWGKNQAKAEIQAQSMALAHGCPHISNDWEKNRLAHCDAQTEEEAQRESDFVMGIIEKEHRQPTFDDAIKYGMRLQKEQMMAKADNGRVNAVSNIGTRAHITVTFDSPRDIKLLDRLKVIIIK